MLEIPDVCNLYAWLYTDLPVPAGTFDHIIPVDGCYCAVKKIDGVDYVLFRGSVTALDWIEDFTRVSEPFCDPLLGPVHPGFMLGVAAIRDRVDALVGDNVIVVGHSLGAGHAQIYAGWRVASGKKVNRLILYGSPRAGMGPLANVLLNTPIWTFRNRDDAGHDLVTDVPYTLGKLLNYVHPRNLTDVSASPPDPDKWGLFRYHHFRLYCEAMQARGAAAVSLSA